MTIGGGPCRERVDDRVVLQFEDDGHTRALVEEFVRDERQCCAFFGFSVRQDAEDVVLELSALEPASHMLDAVWEAFDPALEDGERLALQRAHAVEPAHDHGGCGC